MSTSRCPDGKSAAAFAGRGKANVAQRDALAQISNQLLLVLFVDSRLSPAIDREGIRRHHRPLCFAESNRSLF